MVANGFCEDLIECLKLGILHIPSGRFLTAEIFNNEINISGTALRRRQVWTLFTNDKHSDIIYLQNHLGRFLSTNKDGKISTTSKSPGVEECFRLEFSPDGTGEWAFKSDAYNFYLSGSDKQISCFSKSPVWWSIRLAIHPQVHIRHQFRSRYLHLLNDGCEVRADYPYPWGPESIIWLEQPPMMPNQSFGSGPPNAIVGRAAVSRLGRVALRLSNGKYLKPSGEISNEMKDDVLYAIELCPGNPTTYSFRDHTGAYLTTIGPGTTKIKSTNNSTSVGKEDLFLIERVALQIGILAHNHKFASFKQGVEISANQRERDGTSIFQLEYIGGKGLNVTEILANGSLPIPSSGPEGDVVKSTDVICNIPTISDKDIYFLTTGFWRLRSQNGKLWKLAASSGIKNLASDGDPDSLFEILTVNSVGEDGSRSVVLRSNQSVGGQSLTARKLGAISTSGRVIDDKQTPNPDELFRIILINRSSLVFMSSFTFGFLTRGKQNLDANGVTSEPFILRLTNNNTYNLFARNSNTSYSLWTAGFGGQLQLEVTSKNPDDESDNDTERKHEFQFHFLGHGRILIQALGNPDGPALVKAESKGEVKLEIPTELNANYIWEI